MTTIWWGFYLHVEGMTVGTSTSVGVGSGSFGVQGPSYNQGGAGQGGCYFALSYKGSKRIYSVQLDFVSIQGQGLIQPATEFMDNIGDISLHTFMNSRFSLEVHQYSAPGNKWKDVPLNIKLTIPHGTNSSMKEKIILERNQLVSLKGFVETPTIIRGKLVTPNFNNDLWDACFGRK